MKAVFKDAAKAVRDFKFYKQVKDFQISKSVKYILSLVFIIALLLTVRMSYDIQKGLGVAEIWVRENLPVIEIQNGVVSVDADQPYEIAEEDFALILDTTGQVTSLDNYERGILLTKNKLMYKESAAKTETHDLSNVQALTIDENFIKTLKKNLLWILFPIILVIGYISLCIAKFFQILFFSLLSMLIASSTNVKLTYRQIFNIGIYAITPSIILGALLAIFGIRIPFFGIMYSGLYIVYLIMALRNCKEEPQPTEESPTS